MIEQNFLFIILIGRKAPSVSRYILTSAFYSQLDETTEAKWKQSYDHPIHHTLYASILHGFIIPARRYHQFLQTYYLRRCPPDRVATGLSNLPVRFEYLDGKPNFQKQTTMKLPLTGGELSGKRLYSKILKRYTTLNVTAHQVYDEGKKQLEFFFPKVFH